MAQWLNWGKGTSGSPNSISGTINTYATCTGTAGQTSLTTALSASAGDQILIHQTQGTGAGNWEICEVVSDAGATLNLKTALVNSYTTGAQAVLIPQYTGGTISGTVTGTAWNGSVGGIIALMSNGDLTISGTISAPVGYRGQTSGTTTSGKQGEGMVSAGGTQSTAANGNGGGGGTYSSPNRAGGGGGGHASSGTAGNGATNGGTTGGTGGSSVGNAPLTSLFFGGAGGTGGTYSKVTTSGGGGGIVIIFSKTITISGSVSVNGINGDNAGVDKGSSGGGAGGSCLIKCQVANLGTNKITASGGAGGTTPEPAYSGASGAGSAGRIRCDYFTSITGSTTPTLSSAQDLTLNVSSSGFFNFF